MARYTGPKNRIARRFGANIFGRARNPLVHKQNPPGQHGARHKKKSDYGVQLEEKQKLRALFGMLSQKQLVRYYKQAARKHADTATMLLQSLECRLDSVVYRLKFAPTIFSAHQLVSHGHILVNGQKVDRRSFQVKPGMVISLHEKTRNLDVVRKGQDQSRALPDYLTLSEDKCSGELTSLPSIDQVPLALPVNLAMICEFLAHTN